MLIDRLRDTGISSDALHGAAVLSILGSIWTWRKAKGGVDAAHVERRAIFIGLWAPTFFALADAVGTQEAVKG